MLGDETAVPRDFRPKLKDFVEKLRSAFRDIGPALSLIKLPRGAASGEH
jgi:hypothetical protein